MGNVADGWNLALRESEAPLVAAFHMVVQKFNESLHPRGADGRFISTGGWVKWKGFGGQWQRGEVEKIGKTHANSALVTIKRSDGTKTTATSDKLYSAQSPIAKIGQPFMNKLHQIGPQGGSNPGGLYEHENGSKYYIKQAKSEKHAINELLAHKLYAAAGVATPQVGLTDDNKKFVAKIENSVAWNAVPHEHKEHVYDQIRKNFTVDAWLANWDAPVSDNIRVNEQGVPLRVDAGGALDYRAQGASKISNLTPEVKELKTLRDPHVNSYGYHLYGPTTKEQEEDGIKRILAISPETIKHIVKEEGGPDRLANDLIARRAWLATHYGFQLPEATGLGKDIISEHDVKTHGEEVQAPSLAPAVTKLSPGEKPAITVGSPVWLKQEHKAEYGKNIGDIWTVHEDHGGGNYGLTAVKGKKMINYVSADHIEPLRENHAAFDTVYADGETKPSIGDHISLSTGETGVVDKLYPKFAKVKLDGKDGEFGQSKTIAVKNLNLKTKQHEQVAEENKTGLYALPFTPEAAAIQNKYLKSTVAAVTEGTHTGDKTFKTAELHPTQPKDLTDQPSGMGPKGLKPLVIKTGGKHYLIDGHHRAMKSDKIYAHFVDYDKPVAAESDHASQKPEVDEWWTTHDWSSGGHGTEVTTAGGLFGTIEHYSPGMPYAIVHAPGASQEHKFERIHTLKKGWDL